jgi:hypothetical protein
MASAVQERRQAPADGPGRAGKEYPVTHHRYSFATIAQQPLHRQALSDYIKRRASNRSILKIR